MTDFATMMLTRFRMLRATRGRGATAVEYALMVALIAIAVIAAVTLLGSQISAAFNASGSALAGD